MSVPNLFAEPKQTEQPDKKFLKRIDELIDESELEAMAEIDKQIRSKNAKSALILMTLVGLAAILYFGIQNQMIPGMGEETQMASAPPAPITPNPAPETQSTAPVVPETVSEPTKAQVEVKGKNGVDMEEQAIKAISQALSNLDESQSTTAEEKAIEQQETLVAIEEPKPEKTIAPVIEEPVAKPPVVETPPSGNYFVQVGAFSVKPNADRLVTKLQKAGMTTQVSINEGKADLFTVYIGGFNSPKSADFLLKELQGKGYQPSLVPDGENTYALVLEKSAGKTKAEKLKAELGKQGIFTNVKRMKVSTSIYVVRVGGFASDAVAKDYQKKLAALGYPKTLVRNLPNQT